MQSHEFKNHSYSNLVLVLSIIWNTRFQQDFLISDLAAELDVSVNYLMGMLYNIYSFVGLAKVKRLHKPWTAAPCEMGPAPGRQA